MLKTVFDNFSRKAGKQNGFPEFEAQIRGIIDRIFKLYSRLYSDHPDYEKCFNRLLDTMWVSWRGRRESYSVNNKPVQNWYEDNSVVGAVLYVDLFAGSIKNLFTKIDYLEQLGINYLHLMPVYQSPPCESDGGYAVSDYRNLQEGLGTVSELARFADELHKRGIRLVLDFILNHVSDQHSWAKQALAKKTEYLNYFYIFRNKSEADEYQHTLRDIFPSVRPGSFTWNEQLESWIWTTFHSYQWDLNYSNPAVFTAMAGEMLAIAGIGADVLRFDALAFTWKQKSTSCENLPEAHTLIRAFKAVCSAVIPGIAFKSEAIVHPDEVVKYISEKECELSYNPLLMALSWEALATRETRLLHASMKSRFQLEKKCAWVNYIRCHDDIGWTFSDEDAGRLGINAHDHRKFLNDFYTGRFPGSFARGLPFQENKQTGDVRIAGTCASLAGLEKAIDEETEANLAVSRILLLYSIAFSIGGIPLLSLGDELGLLNNYNFTDNPARRNDSRWLHRLPMDWKLAEKAAAGKLPSANPAARIFNGIKKLGKLRKTIKAFKGNQTEFIDPFNPHVLVYRKTYKMNSVLVIANFSEHLIPLNIIFRYQPAKNILFHDLYQDKKISHETLLEPYEFLWLENYGS